MEKKLNIWFDKEADFLEISLSNKKGFFKEIEDDVFEKVDQKGNKLGIAIFNISKKADLKEKKVKLPFEIRAKA